MSLAPGVIRDSISKFIETIDRDASTDEIIAAVNVSVKNDQRGTLGKMVLHPPASGHV